MTMNLNKRKLRQTKAIPLYKSRESAISDMIKPLEYSELAEADTACFDQVEELEDSIRALGDACDDYFGALYDFADDNNDEMQAGVDMMALALDDAWATAQLHLSKLAVMLGIEGNESYQRKLDQ